MFDRMPKIVGVTWPRPRPLSGKIICAPAIGIPDTKLHTKFEVLAQVVFEILPYRPKRIVVTSLTFQGHVTSSVTWPFVMGSPYAFSYWWSFGTKPPSL